MVFQWLNTFLVQVLECSFDLGTDLVEGREEVMVVVERRDLARLCCNALQPTFYYIVLPASSIRFWKGIAHCCAGSVCFCAVLQCTALYCFCNVLPVMY